VLCASFISLDPFWVTPVITILYRPALLDKFTPSSNEVDYVFTSPFRAFLNPTFAEGEPMVHVRSKDWLYYAELPESQHPWLASSPVCMSHSPLTRPYKHQPLSQHMADGPHVKYMPRANFTGSSTL
jgi:hypothetical protein